MRRVQCESTGIWVDKQGNQIKSTDYKHFHHFDWNGQCQSIATTTRKTWRFGDESKGEPAVVDMVFHLCSDCAKQWDESIREAEAEARMS